MTPIIETIEWRPWSEKPPDGWDGLIIYEKYGNRLIETATFARGDVIVDDRYWRPRFDEEKQDYDILWWASVNGPNNKTENE